MTIGGHLQHLRRRNLAAGSIEKRASVLRRCQAHVGRPLLRLTTAELVAWLDSRDVSPRTRYSDISHLAAFYRWAIVEELTDRDPTARIERPRCRPGLPRPIPTVDLRRAVAAASIEVAAMLSLAALGGLRCCELAALDGQDVLDSHDPPVVVVHGKGRKDRVIPLHPEALAALRVHGIPARGPVFRRGTDRMPAWRVSHVIREHLHACGIAASAHQLRHWFGTNALEASGGDLRLVQELLGHSSPATTAIYTAWSQRRAASVVAGLTAA